MSAKVNKTQKKKKPFAQATPKRGPNGKFLKKGETVTAEPKAKKDEPKKDTHKTVTLPFSEIPLPIRAEFLHKGIVKHHEVYTPEQMDAIIVANRKENNRLRDYIRSEAAAEDARLKHCAEERENICRDFNSRIDRLYTEMKVRCFTVALSAFCIGLVLGVTIARMVYTVH